MKAGPPASERVELPEMLGQQIVEGDARLVAVGMHGLGDRLDAGVDRRVVGESELLLAPAVVNGLQFLGVGRCDEGRVPIAERNAEMLDDRRNLRLLRASNSPE